MHKIIFEKLKKLYPDAKCELDHKNPFELLVSTVLSAQCTDKQVNKVTKTLFQKYKTPFDYISVEQEELEKDIKSIGLFKSKAQSLQTLSESIIKKFNVKVPKNIKDLLTLRGVGRKTANVVLWNAFGINEGIPVDTHVKRLSKRLELTKEIDVVKIEKDLMKIYNPKKWGNISHYLILHGRRVCKARKPNCMECKLFDICPQSEISSH